VKFDLTADPIKVGKLMSTGLKPGMFLYARKGLAIMATASAKSSTPIACAAVARAARGDLQSSPLIVRRASFDPFHQHVVDKARR
jgi:hypothetical protein